MVLQTVDDQPGDDQPMPMDKITTLGSSFYFDLQAKKYLRK
jgi:hypothetical protein